MSGFDTSNPQRPTILKDPNAELDYTWDWTNWLDAVTDTISSFTIAPLDPSVTFRDSGIVGAKKVTAVLIGGTADQEIGVKCSIVTAGLRKDDRTIYLRLRQR